MVLLHGSLASWVDGFTIGHRYHRSDSFMGSDSFMRSDPFKGSDSFKGSTPSKRSRNEVHAPPIFALWGLLLYEVC